MKKLALAGILCAGTFAAAQEGRLKPLESFDCDRNNLTSFTGKVIGYQRSRTGLRIRVHTDEDTFEKFSLTGTRGLLEKKFRLNGAAFAADDWKKIELSSARTQPKVRITVWECSKPKALMFDWKPSSGQ